MSLFRPYIYKPKPDLPADRPVKHGFFLFFELFFRKFWRFVTVNIYYFLVTLPMLIYVYFTINGYFAELLTTGSGDFTDLMSGIGIYASVTNYIPHTLCIIILVISCILYGPATMGITYIFRNFAREEHAWMSDFVSRGKQNFRQGLFFGILDIVVVSLLVTGIVGTYFTGAISIIIKTLSIMALIVYLFMRHYFYMTAVTVNLSCFAIIKNAWLFVVLGFWRNLVSGLVCLVMTFICFFTGIPLLAFVITPFLYYSITGFAVVFTCYPVVKRYIVVPALEMEEKNKAEETKKDEKNSLNNKSGEVPDDKE